MKTYIVEWCKKTRNGVWRDYRKIVQTEDIKSCVKDEMKLAVGHLVFGLQFKGTFTNATEVCKSDKLSYAYKTIKNGEYWFVKNGAMASGVCKWVYFYDHRLKKWILG